MTDYLSGSKEQVVVDLTCDAAGFAVANWTGEMTFVTAGNTLYEDTATWISCTLPPGSSSAAFNASLMLTTDVTLTRGVYDVYVRLTKTGDSAAEKPIVPADGYVRIR